MNFTCDPLLLPSSNEAKRSHKYFFQSTDTYRLCIVWYAHSIFFTYYSFSNCFIPIGPAPLFSLCLSTPLHMQLLTCKIQLRRNFFLLFIFVGLFYFALITYDCSSACTGRVLFLNHVNPRWLSKASALSCAYYSFEAMTACLIRLSSFDLLQDGSECLTKVDSSTRRPQGYQSACFSTGG